MSIANMTGSESLRFEQMHDSWLVFEPESHEKALQYPLYTVPLGQDVEPELVVDSGSVKTDNDGIRIEKFIYRFNTRKDATDFITDIGPENVISVLETIETGPSGLISTVVEVQVVNFRKIDFIFDYIDYDIKKGFIVEVYKSGSIEEGGTRLVSDEIRRDGQGRIVSDTYEKYFSLELDVADG